MKETGNKIARLEEDAGRQTAQREEFVRWHRALAEEVMHADIEPIERRHQRMQRVAAVALMLLMAAVGHSATAQQLPKEKVYSSQLFGQKASVETMNQIIQTL